MLRNDYTFLPCPKHSNSEVLRSPDFAPIWHGIGHAFQAKYTRRVYRLLDNSPHCGPIGLCYLHARLGSNEFVFGEKGFVRFFGVVFGVAQPYSGR